MNKANNVNNVKPKKACKPRYDPNILVCPPDKAGKGFATRFFGILCRAVVTMFAIWGLALLFADAVRLDVGAGYLFLVSLLSTAALSLWIIPKVGPFLTVGSIGAYVGIKFLTVPAWYKFAASGVLSVYNAFMQRLADKNFLRMLEFKVDIDELAAGFDSAELIRYGMGLITFVLALAFVPFIVKRTRIIVPAAVSTALLVIIFTYNMSNANWAIALVIASFCAVIVLNIFDRRYIKDPKKHGNGADVQLFGESDRPALPEELAARLEAEEKAAAEREREKSARAEERKAEKEYSKTLDAEISGYFGSEKAKKKNRPEKVKAGKEIPIEKKRKKEIAAQMRKIKRYDRVSDSAKSAMGGFAALATFLIAMLLLLFPALLTNDNFRDIPFISQPMEYYREYLTAFLQGDDIVIDDLEYARNNANFAPRSTDATPRNFKGTQYFFIETSYSSDLYMPGWIATDYKDGSWYTAAYRSDTYNAYRSLYSAIYDRTSTPAEDVYFNFLDNYAPYMTHEIEFADNKLYINSAYALIAEQVNIRRLATIGTYVYLPSKFNADYKLREYGLASESDLTFVNFFDGIYSGQKFNELGTEYAGVSYSFLQTNPNWINNLAPLMAEFNEGYTQILNRVLVNRDEKIREYKSRDETLNYIVRYLYSDVEVKTYEAKNLYARGGGGPFDAEVTKVTVPDKYRGAGIYHIYYDPRNDVTVVRGNVGSSLGGEYIDWEITPEGEVSATRPNAGSIPFAVRYAGIMTPAEKLGVASMYYDYYIYRNFVYDTYTGTAESEIITDYYNDILSSSGIASSPKGINAVNSLVYSDRHKLVMSVIESLCGEDSGYTYTLNPEKQGDPSLDGVENFLTVTKEGYCVQFASAAALILREAGIPVRYVEGYIAADMAKYQSRNAEWSYYSIVKDEDAHAWIEVWYDGIGWIPYEATACYYNAAYGIVDPNPPEDEPDEPVTPTTQPRHEDDEPEDTEPFDIPPEPGTIIDNSLDPEVVKAIVIAAVIVVIIGGGGTLAVILIRKRSARHRAEKEELLTRAENHGFATGEERHAAAAKLIDMTMKLLTAYGTPPGKCEFRDDYAKRIEKVYLTVFGKKVKKLNRHDLTEEELKALEGEEFVTVSDTDFTAIFASIASEEFGTDGMTDDELAALAVFYKRLNSAMPSFLSSFTIFRYKYFTFI